jgi:hypothetical membrane protein
MIEALENTTATDRSTSTNRLLLLGGVTGPVIFLLAFTVAGLLRPDYSPIQQAISDLGVGSNPWLLNVPLVLLGALIVAFCVGFARVLGPRLGNPWRWVCPVLLALPGLGYAWAGIFTEAPATMTLHWVVGMPLVGLGAIAGFLITGLRLRRIESLRGLGTYSVVAGLLTLALIVVMFSTWMLGFGGLTERVFFVEILAWYVVAALRLLRRESTVAGSPAS